MGRVHSTDLDRSKHRYGYVTSSTARKPSITPNINPCEQGAFRPEVRRGHVEWQLTNTNSEGRATKAPR